jgi:hypothetical protein
MPTCAFALYKAPSTLCQDIRSSQGNGSLGISSQATALSRDVKVSAVTVSSIIHKHMSPSFLALGHAVCPSRSLVASRPAITLSLSHVRYTGTEEASRVSKQLMQPQKRHTIEQVVQRQPTTISFRSAIPSPCSAIEFVRQISMAPWLEDTGNAVWNAARRDGLVQDGRLKRLDQRCQSLPLSHHISRACHD